MCTSTAVEAAQLPLSPTVIVGARTPVAHFVSPPGLQGAVEADHPSARATVMPMNASDQRCSCIGTPSNPAAAGSPWSHLCTSTSAWGSDCADSPHGKIGCCMGIMCLVLRRWSCRPQNGLSCVGVGWQQQHPRPWLEVKILGKRLSEPRLLRNRTALRMIASTVSSPTVSD